MLCGRLTAPRSVPAGATMAEAHSAVAFSFSVSHEGVDLNYDHEMLGVVLMSGVRSWNRRLHRFFVSVPLLTSSVRSIRTLKWNLRTN